MVVDVSNVILLVPILTVRTFHIRPPIVCELGNRNTTGPQANTEYEVKDIRDCNKNNLPQINCTTVPGSPQYIANNLSGYGFGLDWQASDGAGGDISVLKGFVIHINILPYDRGRNPLQKCLYVNITKTLNVSVGDPSCKKGPSDKSVKSNIGKDIGSTRDGISKINSKKTHYVRGVIQFHCVYDEDAEVAISIQSYPTPDMCAGTIERNKTIVEFFIPSVQETSKTVTRSTKEIQTNPPHSVQNVIITTVLSCSLVFVVVIVLIICIRRKVCRGPARFNGNAASGTDIQQSNTKYAKTHESPSAEAHINYINSNNRSEMSKNIPVCPTECGIDDDASIMVTARGTYRENSIADNDTKMFDGPLTNTDISDNNPDTHLKTHVDIGDWDLFTKHINFPEMFAATEL